MVIHEGRLPDFKDIPISNVNNTMTYIKNIVSHLSFDIFFPVTKSSRNSCRPFLQNLSDLCSYSDRLDQWTMDPMESPNCQVRDGDV